MRFLHNCYLTVVRLLIYISVLLFSMIMLYPLSVCAEEALPFPDPNSLIDAINQRHWPLVVAITVTFGVWFLRFVIKEKLPSKYVPIVTLISTVLLGSATGIIQAAQMNHTWWIGLIHGFLEGMSVGLSAMGVWSVAGKSILPNVDRE